ncbi:MAG TPA: hypothetical protein VGU66_10010 [Candidatus Elarobacter sp.]|nr:hypothetical protein [Candidatus Elarobacter sp.]
MIDHVIGDGRRDGYQVNRRSELGGHRGFPARAKSALIMNVPKGAPD